MAPDEVSAAVGTMMIQVAYSPAPEVVDCVQLTLPEGATLEQALRSSGLLQRHGLSLDASTVCGVWAKIRPLDHPLREGDRVEVYRPLRVDPKEARRQRYRKTTPNAKGARGAQVAGDKPPAEGSGGTQDTEAPSV